MARAMRTAAALLLISTSLLSAKQSLVVFDFQMVGIDSATAEVAMTILRDRLEGTDSFRLVVPPPGVPLRTASEAAEAAGALGADKALTGSMVQVGKEILVTYKLVDVRTGDVESSDRASISSVEEFDVSFERIANSVANREPFQATGGVGKMIEKEAQRQAALTSVFLTTGYAFPIVRDFPEDPGTMLFTLNSAVSYETPDVLAQGVMGLRTGKNDYRHIYFELLAHKMFSKFDVSPYVGGGLSVGRQWIGGEKTSGLGVVASAGVVLFRTQYFRIIAGGKGTAIFTEDYGMNLMGEVNFGFASPTIGKGGGIDVPSPCAFGCLAAYFISGLAIALTM